MEWLSGGT